MCHDFQIYLVFIFYLLFFLRIFYVSPCHVNHYASLVAGDINCSMTKISGKSHNQIMTLKVIMLLSRKRCNLTNNYN